MDRRMFMEATLGLFVIGTGPVQAAKTSRHFRSLVAKADVPNGNKRIYSRKLLERLVAEFDTNHRLQRGMIGQMGMSSHAVIRLDKASHIVTDMRMKGDYLEVEVEILTTPCGVVLYMAAQEQEVAFRTAGLGSGTSDEKGNLLIDDSYKLIAVNAVEVAKAARIY